MKRCAVEREKKMLLFPHSPELTIYSIMGRRLDHGTGDPVLEALGCNVRLHVVVPGSAPPIHQPVLRAGSVWEEEQRVGMPST